MRRKRRRESEKTEEFWKGREERKGEGKIVKNER